MNRAKFVNICRMELHVHITRTAHLPRKQPDTVYWHCRGSMRLDDCHFPRALVLSAIGVSSSSQRPTRAMGLRRWPNSVSRIEMSIVVLADCIETLFPLSNVQRYFRLPKLRVSTDKILASWLFDARIPTLCGKRARIYPILHGVFVKTRVTVSVAGNYNHNPTKCCA